MKKALAFSRIDRICPCKSEQTRKFDSAGSRASAVTICIYMSSTKNIADMNITYN